MNRDYISIGSSPYDEDCAQVGTANYEHQAKKQCGVFRNQTKSGQNKLTPSAHRAKDRGRTYQGIGDAMAK